MNSNKPNISFKKIPENKGMSFLVHLFCFYYLF